MSDFRFDATDPKAATAVISLAGAAENARLQCSFAPIGSTGLSATITVAVHFKDGKIDPTGSCKTFAPVAGADNLQFSVSDDQTLTLQFDSTQAGELSKSGRSFLIATTHGWRCLSGTKTAISLNIIRNKDAKPTAAAAATGDSAAAAEGTQKRSITTVEPSALGDSESAVGPFKVKVTPDLVSFTVDLSKSKPDECYKTEGSWTSIPGAPFSVNLIVYVRGTAGQPFEEGAKGSLGQNLTGRFHNGLLSVEFDPRVAGTASKSGKATIVASSDNWARLGASRSSIKGCILRSSNEGRKRAREGDAE